MQGADLHVDIQQNLKFQNNSCSKIDDILMTHAEKKKKKNRDSALSLPTGAIPTNKIRFKMRRQFIAEVFSNN